VPTSCAARAPVVDEIAQRYRESGLDIRIAAPPERVAAAIDRDSLEAALSNLLDNIRQHAGAGATAAISWRRNGTAAVLRVADDGPGISPGNAARIFDRFFTTSRDAGGTGLGLPIVRSRLAALGGAIDLVPSERGAVFEITLPRALAPGLA
jgi:signal transduction histidine kinase